MMEVSINYDNTNYIAASDSYEETLFGFFIGYFAVRLPGYFLIFRVCMPFSLSANRVLGYHGI